MGDGGRKETCWGGGGILGGVFSGYVGGEGGSPKKQSTLEKVKHRGKKKRKIHIRNHAPIT